LIGLSAGVMFILALKGLSHPRTARRGNLIEHLAPPLQPLQSSSTQQMASFHSTISVGLLVRLPSVLWLEFPQHAEFR